MKRATSVAAVVLALTLLEVSAVSAQEWCRFLCAPSLKLKVEPTITFSNLFNRPVGSHAPQSFELRCYTLCSARECFDAYATRI